MKAARLFAFLLLILAPVPSLSAQGKVKVKGHVQDAAGLAQVGVIVLETGTQNMALTDASGDYVITVASPKTASLDFILLGMETVTVPIEGRAVVNVTMREETVALDQVVVTGYSSMSKESYTGSAVTVTSKKLEDRAIASLEEAFRGNVAGALSTSSGQPGESGSIILRGFGSMNASNQPLFVVDGVVWDQTNVSGTDYAAANPLNALNPSDIASLTVLKDAASASLYGSRGANGVVVITTKKGMASDKVQINLSTVNGFSYMTGQPDLVNGPEYAELWVEGEMNFMLEQAVAESQTSSLAIRNSLIRELKQLYADKANYTVKGKNFYEWQQMARNEFNIKYQIPTANGGYRNYDFFCEDADKLPSTDWFKVVSRVAPFTKTSLSFRGGSNSINYYSSLEVFNQQGTIINSPLQRYSLRMRLNSGSKQFVTWGINNYVAYTMQSGPLAGGGFYRSPQYAANVIPPVVPPFLEDGSYNFLFPDNLLNSNNNPIASAYENKNDRPALNVNVVGDVALNFSKDLKLTSRSAVYFYGFRRMTYLDSRFGAGYSADGELTDRNVQRTKLSNSTMLQFDKDWGKKRHHLSASAGIELENLEYRYQTITAQGFGTDESPYLTNSSNASGYAGDGYAYSIFSMITRADYAYRSKILLGASYRRDYSSLFSPEHRAGNFWSVSGGYDIAKENFMRPYRREISQLKVKASYGVNGTLPTEYYYWQDRYPTVRYNNELGVITNYRYRPELTWEGNRVFNVGLDATLFKNRVDITLEYYKRVSNNLLQDVQVSMTSGYRTMLMNTDAGIRNTGVEFSLNANLIKRGEFNWDFGFNISKMSSIYYGLSSEYLDSYQRQIIANGVNVHTWYLREYAKVDEDTGLCMYYAYDEDGNKYMTTASGESPYTHDKQGVPKVLGGITTALSYKGFQLDILGVYGLGHYIYDRLGASLISTDGGTDYTIARSQFDRWTPDHIFAKNPLRVNNVGLTTRSTRFLKKGDYLKLKNIKLSYRFPQKFAGKLGMDHLSAFVQAENPLVWGPFGDYDPEMSISGYRFADLYPTSSIYTLGINIRFK